MEVPFRLPAVVKHTSSVGYLSATVSNDGKTIAVATDEKIELFPTYSPILPCGILKYRTNVDTYNRQMQSQECNDTGNCDVCCTFARTIEEQNDTKNIIMHMTFYGENDQYLIVLGYGTIAIYDLVKQNEWPIINACFDSALDVDGKICMYPISIDRHTVICEKAGVVGLSCLEFMINDRSMELNYYRIIFNEDERWWFLDCYTPVNCLTDIKDEDIPTQCEKIYTEVSDSAPTVEYVTAQQYMDMEDINRVPDEGFYIVEDMGEPVGKNLTQTSSSHYSGGSWYGTTGPKMKCVNLGTPDDGESGSMGSAMPPWIRAHDSDSDSPNSGNPNDIEAFRCGNSLKISCETPIYDSSSGVPDTIHSKQVNKSDATASNDDANVSSEKALSTMYGPLKYYKNSQQYFENKKISFDNNSESKVIGDMDNKATYSESSEPPRVEFVKHDIDGYKKLLIEKSVKKLLKPTTKHKPDSDIEDELCIEKNQEPSLQNDAGASYLVFCVIRPSMSNQEIGRMVVVDYPIKDYTDFDEDITSSDYTFLEENSVEIQYQRHFIVAVSYKFGYIGLFKIKIPYTTLVSPTGGEVLVVRSGEPSVEFVMKFQFSTPMNVENIVYSGGKGGLLAVLGGDATVLLRYPLPEFQYSFADCKATNGALTIQVNPILCKMDVELLFKHYEETFNAAQRIGCFGSCDGQTIFITNSKAGLKVFGTKQDSNRRYLRLSIRYESCISFVDAIWINNTMNILVFMDDGSFVIMTPIRCTQWFNLIPNFLRVNRNMEYVEDEAEFDKGCAVHNKTENPIDYNKMEETHDYKFFHTVDYVISGYPKDDTLLEDCGYRQPVIHAESLLDEYCSRLT